MQSRLTEKTESLLANGAAKARSEGRTSVLCVRFTRTLTISDSVRAIG